MEKRGLGCLKPVYDNRNYQFSTLVASSIMKREKFPNELDFRINPDLIFDQGLTSMCCACACAMSRYITETDGGKEAKLFSPGFIYGNRVKSVFSDCVYEGEGMYLKDALKGLIKNGDCSFDSMPSLGDYQYTKSIYTENKDKLDREAYPYRVSSYYVVKTEKEIKKAIMTTGSVLASFLVTEDWYNAKSDGIICNLGNIEGAHAVLITGWRKVNDIEYWQILNSWGPEWGDQGFGYIPTTERMLESYCIIDDIN